MSTATLPPPTADVPDDDALYEIVNGVRVELAPISIQSSWIATRLCSRLDAFVEANRLGTVVGEALFILDRDENLRRRPDVPLSRPNGGRWIA